MLNVWPRRLAPVAYISPDCCLIEIEPGERRLESRGHSVASELESGAASLVESSTTPTVEVGG